MAALFKRDKVWHFDFRFRGQRHQGSTYCTNKEKAETFVAAYRTNLAHHLVGLTVKEPAPLLRSFLEGAFLEHVRQNAKVQSTRIKYEQGIKRLCEFVEFQTIRLDAINELAIQAYKNYRLAKRWSVNSAITETASDKAMGIQPMPTHTENIERSLSPSTINGELRTLRKALKFAERCGLIRYQPITAVPGEKNREFILDAETEKRYLELAEYPLKQVAILMLDLGVRPEECVGLRKSDISDQVSIAGGKSANARRTLPQSERTKQVFDLCKALFPSSEWVFPSRKGHWHPDSITMLHIKLRRKHNFPKEFVLYSLRHTHATRFAESGASPFEIKTRLGHSSIRMSEKYIHSTPEHMTLAARRFEAYSRMLRGEVQEDTAIKDESKTSS